MTYDVLKSRPSSSSLSSFYHSSIPHVQLPVLGVRGEKDYTALHTLICSRVCSLHSNLTLMCICNKADGNVSTCGRLQQKHLSAGLCACVCCRVWFHWLSASRGYYWLPGGSPISKGFITIYKLHRLHWETLQIHTEMVNYLHLFLCLKSRI